MVVVGRLDQCRIKSLKLKTLNSLLRLQVWLRPFSAAPLQYQTSLLLRWNIFHFRLRWFYPKLAALILSKAGCTRHNPRKRGSVLICSAFRLWTNEFVQALVCSAFRLWTNEFVHALAGTKIRLARKFRLQWLVSVCSELWKHNGQGGSPLWGQFKSLTRFELGIRQCGTCGAG